MPHPEETEHPPDKACPNHRERCAIYLNTTPPRNCRCNKYSSSTYAIQTQVDRCGTDGGDSEHAYRECIIETLSQIQDKKKQASEQNTKKDNDGRNKGRYRNKENAYNKRKRKRRKALKQRHKTARKNRHIGSEQTRSETTRTKRELRRQKTDKKGTKE